MVLRLDTAQCSDPWRPPLYSLCKRLPSSISGLKNKIMQFRVCYNISVFARFKFPITLISLVLTALAQPDSLAVKSQRGRQFMSEGRFAEAVAVYRELASAVPGNAGLLLNLGLAEQMSGKPGDAVVHLSAAAKIDARLYPAWLSMGACYLDLGEPGKAVAPLEKAVALDSRDARPLGMLAEALRATGRFEQAARRLRELARMQPEDPKAWYGLGRSYEALAQRAFERLDAAAPGSAWWLALAAETRQSEGKSRAAFALYREALAKAPAMRGLHAGMAEVYRATGHADWALAEESKEKALPALRCARATPECAFAAGRLLEAARSTQPPTPAASYWQCRAYNRLAMQAFSQLEHLPASVERYALRAEIASGRRRYREAAEGYREALKLAPKDSQLQLGLAAVLAKAGEFQAAQAVLADLLNAAPDSPLINFLYGDLLLTEEHPEQAIPYLEKAVAGNPRSVQPRASLGLAYARTGQPDRALPHLEAALDADADGSLHYQAARIYQSKGQPGSARKALEAYRKLQPVPDSDAPAITAPDSK